MTQQGLRIETGKLFLADRECHDRNVGRLDPLIAEFLVERHVGVAVNGRDHGGLLAGRAELLDIGNNRLEVRMPERRVVDHDVFGRHSLGLKVGLENLVGGARINVVGAG